MNTPATQPLATEGFDDPTRDSALRGADGIERRRARPSSHSTVARLGPRFARLSDLLGSLLLANAVLSLLTMLVEEFLHVDLADHVLTAVGLALLLLTAAAWCAWQWRMAVAAPGQLRSEPAGHIGAWFVPVANLWRPLENMTDLWYAYEPVDDYGWGRDLYAMVWWTLWLASAALGLAGLRSIGESGILGVTLGLAWTLTAVLAWFVVRRLSWRALMYHSH